jgi:acylphosphatase
MAAVARHVRVTGRVQGVFFRAWTREEAQRLGLTGWVRNCSDGSVEAHLEGERATIDQLIERLRRGPPAARVEDVQRWDVELCDFDHFEVRH